MKVTISGVGGTGKSSITRELAVALGWPFESVGGLFREMAAEQGMDVYEFQKVASADSTIDRTIDAETKRYGDTHKDFIFEGWLSWFFIPDSFKIQLIADDRKRFERIAERHATSIEDAERLTRERERIMFERYLREYGITDVTNKTHFDVTIDTTHTLVPEVVERLRTLIREHGTNG